MAPDRRDESPLPLSRVRAQLAGPRGVRRIDALLSMADPAAEVTALAVPDLYQLIMEVGFGEATDLIALASPEQVRGCVDLHAWDRDRLQTAAVEPWLTALIEAGYEKLGQVWEGLDSELTALVLSRWITIYDLSLGEEPPEDAEPLVRTVDGFFGLVFTAEDDESVKLAMRLVEDLYRADLQLARHSLMTARSEVSVELEEMAYRWRAGRMADLGYIEYYEALAVFRPLDPSQVKIGENSQDRMPGAEPGEETRPTSLPVPLAEVLVGVSFLARALDEIREPEEQERLEAAFLVLSNQVLSAVRIQPGDTDAVQAAGYYTGATLALGLEILARGNLGEAAAALRSVALQRLFRVGYGATVRLAGFARAIARRAAAAGDPMVSVIAALAAERPLYARAIDQPPGDGARPFESTVNLRTVAAALTELALRVAIAETLGADLVALAGQPEPRPELDDFVRTALVRALAGGALEPTPLSPDELAAYGTRALAGPGRLSAEARAAAAAALDRHLDAAPVTAGRELVPGLVNRWLDEIEGTDPQHPSGLITSSHHA